MMTNDSVCRRRVRGRPGRRATQRPSWDGRRNPVIFAYQRANLEEEKERKKKNKKFQLLAFSFPAFMLFFFVELRGSTF